MDTLISLDSPEHMRLRMLLPWHVNGTLKADEAVLVSGHVHGCAACQVEMHGLQRLQLQVQSTADQAQTMVAARASLKRFGHTTHRRPGDFANTPQGSGAAYRLFATVRQTWQVRPRLALAACLLPVMLGLAIVFGTPVFEGRYATLSSSETSPDQADLVVVFNSAVPAAELDALLLAIHGRQVGEPNSTGAIRIALDQAAGAPDRMTVVALFRARPDVILAEPVAQR